MFLADLGLGIKGQGANRRVARGRLPVAEQISAPDPHPKRLDTSPLGGRRQAKGAGRVLVLTGGRQGPSTTFNSNQIGIDCGRGFTVCGFQKTSSIVGNWVLINS